MKTVLEINDALLQAAELLASESNRTLEAVVEDALRETLTRSAPKAPRPRVELPSFGSGGLRPGVSLDNNAKLLDLMEGIE